MEDGVSMVYEKLCEIFGDVFELDGEEFSRETTFESLNADAFDLIEIAMIIEEEFDIVFDDDELDRMENLGQIEDYITKSIEEFAE